MEQISSINISSHKYNGGSWYRRPTVKNRYWYFQCAKIAPQHMSLLIECGNNNHVKNLLSPYYSLQSIFASQCNYWLAAPKSQSFLPAAARAASAEIYRNLGASPSSCRSVLRNVVNDDRVKNLLLSYYLSRFIFACQCIYWSVAPI